MAGPVERRPRAQVGPEAGADIVFWGIALAAQMARLEILVSRLAVVIKTNTLMAARAVQAPTVGRAGAAARAWRTEDLEEIRPTPLLRPEVASGPAGAAAAVVRPAGSQLVKMVRPAARVA